MLIPREALVPFLDFLRGLGLDVKLQVRTMLGERLAIVREYGTGDGPFEFFCPDAKQVEEIERQWTFYWQKQLQFESEVPDEDDPSDNG